MLGNADFDIDFTFEEETSEDGSSNAEYGCGVTFKNRFLYLGGGGQDTRQVISREPIVLVKDGLVL